MKERRADGAWDIDPEQMGQQLVSWRERVREQKTLTGHLDRQGRKRYRGVLTILSEIERDLAQRFAATGAPRPSAVNPEPAAVTKAHVGMRWNDTVRALKTMAWTMSHANQARFERALPELEAIAESLGDHSAPDPAERRAELTRWLEERRMRQTPEQKLIDDLLDLEGNLQALASRHPAADREPIEEMLTTLRKHYRQMRAKYGSSRSPKTLFETPYANPPETP